MKILIFLHGTIIMHKNAAGKTREEIIEQIIEEENSVRDFKNYIPIGNAPEKLFRWASQGAQICYLSALTEDKKARGDETVGKEGLEADKIVLERYNFPAGIIYHRGMGAKYKDIIEKMSPIPDVLVEDDCKSIGGIKEMTYYSLNKNLKKRIKLIVVKEFGGIDHLPDDINFL
ncbi:MAG: hypothetical protein PHT51_02310 [Patescibacteria group bacterium]|nr:hypothetical protein [Patescibacteria group bacterium]MDD4611058.1 hypothetical protein [Patescibacteria group bacterium]